MLSYTFVPVLDKYNSSSWCKHESALPCDDGEVGWGHAGAHEKDNIFVPGLPVVHHLLLEELQVILVVAVNLQKANGHLAMPATLVHLPPATLESQAITSVVCGYILTFTPRFSVSSHVRKLYIMNLKQKENITYFFNSDDAMFVCSVLYCCITYNES